MPQPIPVLFHPRQLDHQPLYEWAFGDKLAHPETSHRAERIHEALCADPAAFSIQEPDPVSMSLIRHVHHPHLLSLYRTAATNLAADVTLYPSVFPKRQQTSADPFDLHQAGYFCFDSGTPLTASAWEAATWSASCATQAGKLVASGKERLAYGLCRPPGHHASRDLFGGYCYFNNAAIVATALRRKGRVAILDVDFHHGNGTQDIFYRDDRVLFVSIHGDPQEFYPYFSGFSIETGSGKGKGFTLNIPLPHGTDGQAYMEVLERQALPSIQAFRPDILILSAGLDTYSADPIGRFTLDTPDFYEMGDRIGRIGLPTVALQEGGYWVDALGNNAAALLRGLRDGINAVDQGRLPGGP